jgi:exodeoxyribonuclease VII small subunit
MSEETKTNDFETKLATLEKIVSQLEGELKLEEALTLFEEGLGLSQECEEFLKHAENKIEILRRTAAGTQIDTVNESEFLVAQS